jgi:hypothetical protein
MPHSPTRFTVPVRVVTGTLRTDWRLSNCAVRTYGYPRCTQPAEQQFGTVDKESVVKKTLRWAQWTSYALAPVVLALVGGLWGRRWF